MMSENNIFNHVLFDEPDIIVWDDGRPRCGYCENELESEQKICGICGHKLNWRKK